MRTAPFIVLAVLAFAACGGSNPTPKSASADTSSLEGNSGPAKDSSNDTPADSASTGAPSATAGSSAPVAASTAPDASTTAAPASFHPSPSVTGAIDGKPFQPKVAQVIGPMKKDGRIPVTLTEATDCPAPGEAKADRAALTMLVPWQDGYKVDLAALKLSGKKGPGDIGFSRGKKDASTTFKPSGTVTIVSAPLDKGATGKLKIDLQSGDYMLAGTLDIEMCVAPK